MTNKEAIEALNNWDMACPICEKRKSEEKGVCADCRFNKALDLAIKALENSSWIPVSKGLPEKKGYYLTSTVFNEVYCDFWNGGRFARTEEILAWMPLPKPYTKEDSENENI